jgi:hypothetical protein
MQGGGIEEVAQPQQGIDAEARLEGVADPRTRQGIEHPRGDGNLYTIREFDHKTV